MPYTLLAMPAHEHCVPLDYRPAVRCLDHRVIAVTGAGSGIGRCVSIALAARGATVVLIGKTVKKLEAVYDLIEVAGGPQPAIYPMNLLGATPDDHGGLAERLATEFGRLDGLLHNAATVGGLTPLEHYPLAGWLEVLQVNLNATFLMTRACLPLLKRAGDASVLFTTDPVAQRPRAYWGAYAVSKAAVEALAGTLAEELASVGHVRVNCISPPTLRTALRAAAYPAEDPRTLEGPESVVDAYVYVLGPDGRGVHGQNLNLRDFSLRPGRDSGRQAT